MQILRNSFIISVNRLRNLFKINVTKKSPKLAATSEPLPKNVDLIGPADKISNIRQYRFYIPENESKCEYDYRIMREKVLAWNQEYWTQSNLNFIQSKRTFIENIETAKRLEQRLGMTNHSPTRNINAKLNEEINESAEMTEFYRKFLNDNYHNHYEYNKKWFKLNLQLLWPATKVYFYRLNKRLKSK